MAKRKCGYCVYMDPSKFKDGQFKCEKKSTWVFADSEEADNCYKYCERFRRDMHIGDETCKASADYRKGNSSYTSVGCYITTITVGILGLKDDCDELQTLRAFRKDYMQNNPECKDLLIKYDALGPSIARLLNVLPNREEVALDLYRVYIKGAVSYIKKGEFASAITLYSEMMNNLIKLHMSSYAIGNEVYQKYDMTSAGHGKVTMN